VFEATLCRGSHACPRPPPQLRLRARARLSAVAAARCSSTPRRVFGCPPVEGAHATPSTDALPGRGEREMRAVQQRDAGAARRD
jgi:hypothetical protein